MRSNNVLWTLIASVSSLVVCFTVSAAPFARWLEVQTASGEKVRIWAEGDEYSASFETEDGRSVVFDQARKAYVYVDQDADGALVPTDIALGEEVAKRNRISRLRRHLRDTSDRHRKSVRERFVREQVDSGLRERWRALKARNAAAKGEPRLANGTVVGVTILIDFPVSSYDSSSYWNQQHPSVTATDIGNMLNGENFTKWGNASSVRSYYKDASCGRLDYSNVVLGPIMAPRPRSFYNDSSVDAGLCAQVLLMEVFEQMTSSPKWSTEYLPALQKASYAGKNILALNVLYAGPFPSVWAYGLWPHKSTLLSSVYSLLPITIDGDTKHLYTYEISPVTSSPSIGTICHESGHMVCDFPDFYSYYYGNGCGAGKFSLMAGTTDDKNPEYFDPYLRAVAGWITPKALPSSGTVTVNSSLTDVWKYVNPSNPREYYLIENRQQTGRDVGIPGAGVLIWRCDEDSENYYADPLPSFANKTDGTQYRLENELSLEQADGLYEIEQRLSIYGNAGDVWHARTTGETGGAFTDDTLPTAKWKDASRSGLKLSRFSASGQTMTFMVGDGESGEKPNFTPYTPAGCGGPLVVTDDPDDLSGGLSFASGKNLYVYWAFLNEGADAPQEFRTALYVDGVEIHGWRTVPPFHSGYYIHPTEAYALDELEKGVHTIKVVVDSNGEVAESDESDNECEIVITIDSDLNTALDNDDEEFETGGGAEWFAQTAVTSDGVDAAQSGAIGDGEESVLSASVYGTGVVSFFWNVSSEAYRDKLTFYIDGEPMDMISGSPGWSKVEVDIPDGEDEWHELEWIYSKNGSRSVGQDCGWVDQVEWLPTGAQTVSVTFYANGGTLPSGSSSGVCDYYVGSRYGDLPVPTKSGYSFAGWWTSSSGGQQVTANSVVSAFWTSLYAHWTQDSGGGGGGGGSVTGGKYALCVGLNEYNQSYIPSYNWLHQCVADANSVYDMLVDYGEWEDEGAFRYENGQGTRSAILSKLAELAAAAKSGDQVVYYHSSHGGRVSGTSVYLCTYDGDLTDEDFAKALAAFKSGVKLLIVIDACHSGGMFQAPRAGGGRAAAADWDFAASVMKKLDAIRRSAAARGENGAAKLAGEEIAWVTAANYDEYSYELQAGPGGVFTRAFTQGIIGGAADSPDLEGDGNGQVTAYEAAQYAARVIANWSRVQCPYESASRAIVFSEVESATLDEALGESYQWETDAEDGDYADNEWFSLGDLPGVGWFGEGTESLDGCAARSGAIIDYERTSLRTSVSGEGTVSFKWRVSSELNFDWLTFSVDGTEVGRISGTDGDWTEFTYVVFGSGAHELAWTYAKDFSGSEGEDCGWVDQFRWSGGGIINPGHPPANDDFADAETLVGGSGSGRWNNDNATEEDGDPLGGCTVWWRWTAPADGTVTFSTAGSEFDTILGVYTGSRIYALEEIAYNDDDDDADDLTSKVTFDVEEGVEYMISVTGYWSSSGVIRLAWDGPGDDDDDDDDDDGGGGSGGGTGSGVVPALTVSGDSDFTGFAKSTYTGWVVNKKQKSMDGTVTVKTAKIKARDGTVKVTASVVLRGWTKPVSLSGTGVIEKGKLVATVSNIRSGNVLSLTLTTDCMTGELDDAYTVSGVADAVNRQGASAKQGNWVLSAYAQPTMGDFRGFCGFTVKVNAKGVAKLAGTLPDGTKLSFTSTLISDGRTTYLPVFAKAYSKKGDFGGLVIDMDRCRAYGDAVGYWDGVASKAPVQARLSFSGFARAGASTPMASETEFLSPWALAKSESPAPKAIAGYQVFDDAIPDRLALTFAGKKWTPLPHASKPKLTYAPATGAITGSFTVLTSGKKFKAAVNGVWVDGRGDCNAAVKGKTGFGMRISK